MKKCLQTCAKGTYSDYPMHVQASALHSHILKYPVILLADSEGPDQVAEMCTLIWAHH